MRETHVEELNLWDKWIFDERFNKQDQYFKRRLRLRGYLKDLAALAGIDVDNIDSLINKD